jgi:ATP-dependent RNA helicase DeaD
MKNQVVLEVENTVTAKANIEQYYYHVRRSDKLEAIKNIIALADGFHGIIFCQTKVIVNEISDALKRGKFNADCIHGEISQTGRERILKKFKEKKINILVATDVAARGIDVADLTHVINHSLPREIDSYVHRIGRTGRAGKKGIAITFIDNREEYKIKQLIRETKNNILPGQLPSAAEIAVKKQELLLKKLEEVIQTKDISEYDKISKELVKAFGDIKVVSALLHQLHGPSKPEPKEERYDHDEYRRKSGRSGHGKGGPSKSFGRDNGKSRKERSFEKNRATRRSGKRTDSPFGKSEKGGYEGDPSKKRQGGKFKKRS